MRLMPNKNTSFSEDRMQTEVAEYFSHRKFIPSNWNGYINTMIIPKIYREVRIPNIGRISDVIIYITDRRIINVECKLADYNLVLSQAKDHLNWADYSYVCLPPNTYLPSFIIDEMITTGVGLLFWCPEYFVEVLQSGYNKNKDKTIRSEVLKRLKQADCVKTGQSEANQQVKIEY